MAPRRPEEINEVSAAIGEIRAELGMAMRLLIEDRAASATYRTDVREQMGKIEDAVNSIARDVTEMKPEVEIVRQARLHSEATAKRRDNQLKTAGALVALAVGLSAFGRQVLDGILALWHHLWSAKLP